MASASLCAPSTRASSAAASTRSTRCWRSGIHTANSTSGFIALGIERLQHAFFEHDHFLLRILEGRLAELQQLGAALVGGERLLQRQLAAFHALDDGFELGERAFERGYRRFGHGRRAKCKVESGNDGDSTAGDWLRKAAVGRPRLNAAPAPPFGG